MKSKFFFTLLLAASALVLAAKPLTLVNNGKASSTIVIADNASEVARTAAELLASHIERVSGVWQCLYGCGGIPNEPNGVGGILHSK